jgi:simple sugar transport system ATP-binding protein/ribose transport system ATP-binding protein
VKRFGGVQALNDVSLEIYPGTLHAFVGENGAGKSTLGKILAGVYSPDAGTLEIEGSPISFDAPRAALSAGVTMIAQEMMLVPQLSVLDNVFLGNEPQRAKIVKSSAMRTRFRGLCERAGFELPAGARVGDLRVAEQQKVEILRALSRNARLIVMDEPTAALSGTEVQGLFSVMRSLREAGTTIVFISHSLEDVLALADEVTIFRDGQVVRTSAAKAESVATLVTGMLGRRLDVTFPEQAPRVDGPVALSVRNLSRGTHVRDVSFDLRKGEVLGLAGLVGSGRSELLRTIFGAEPADSGEIDVFGEAFSAGRPGQAIRAGIALLPESRKDQGLLMQASIARNVTLPHPAEISTAGIVSRRAENARVRTLSEQLDVRAPSIHSAVSTLSGGNQQKVLFAKWLMNEPRILLADEPTRGVDIGAKRAIYELINSLAASGMALIVVSSELEEVMGLAHRILVMRQGSIVGEFDSRSTTEDELLHAAFDSPAASA